MNYRLLSKLLSRITFLIAATMVFSLPWAHPALQPENVQSAGFEFAGFFALVGSIAMSLIVGGVFWYFGKTASGQLYRREAMAIVGLSWILATVLGALPYALSGTCTGESANGDPVRMQPMDWMFESQSGFSTTGATVLGQLEEPKLVPRCILFWRSSTHFLGGLGIIVLFVAVLGQGSAGKALMRSEMPGPSKEGSQARMQHTAWVFASIYCALNAVLAICLTLCGLSLFDSLCHAFGTMATGGFSTYDGSVGGFASENVIGPGAALWAELIIVVFMILAGTNFTLLYFLVVLRKPGRLIADFEWRTYMWIIIGVTLLVMVFGYGNQDDHFYEEGKFWSSAGSALRHGGFQVVSILTTTGYGSAADFDQWNSFGRGVLLLLMFVGGCAGSTGGGMKVIRHVLFVKILHLELEKSYHPTVVRPLRIGGDPVDDQDLRKNILVYFGLVLVIFMLSWIVLVTIEPSATWESRDPGSSEHKLLDSASAVAATLNNIGPGLGTVGPKQNYAHFSQLSKLLFTVLMMIGRLEIFVIVVLFLPGFWRSR
jgi:trk system potassium uptake protein TrkH